MHSTRVVAQSELEVDDPFKFRLTLLFVLYIRRTDV